MSKGITRRQTVIGIVTGFFGILGLRLGRTGRSPQPASIIVDPPADSFKTVWLHYDADGNLVKSPANDEALRRLGWRRRNQEGDEGKLTA